MSIDARRLAPLAVLACFSAVSGGCVYAALVKPKAEKVVTVSTGKAETLAKVAATFKDLGLSGISTNEKAGYVGASRGLGLGESTFIEARTVPDSTPLQVRFQVKSSGDAQKLLDEIVAAFGKRAK